MIRILLCLVIISLNLNSVFAADTVQNKYQAILDKYIPADGPGAAVIVSQNGRVLFQGAAGLANIELNVGLTNESVFRLGSITKQFTAAVIMMLQEQKQLSIKDNIHKYVANFPTEGNQVSIENLLTHTSGIANYTEDEKIFHQEIQVPISLDQMLVRFAEHPMALKTGEAMRYSNTGYVILGKIIEVVSGQSYSDFIEQQIFKKLDMNSSRYGGSQIIPNRASGYDMSPHGLVNASSIDMSWPHAAGSLLSTVGDLNIWFNALRSGKLISKASYQQMITPFKLNDGSLSNYGFGLGIGKLNKYHTISHSGGIPGFVTTAVYLPEVDLYVASLNNLSSGNPRLLSNLLVAQALDIALPKFEAIKINQEKLKPLLGLYKINDDSQRRLFIQEGKIYTQRDKREKYQVMPMSDNSFFYEDSLSYIVIENNDKGQLVMNFYADLSLEPQSAIKQ